MSKTIAQSSHDEKLTRGQRMWDRLVRVRRTAQISTARVKLLTESWKETEGLPNLVGRAGLEPATP